MEFTKLIEKAKKDKNIIAVALYGSSLHGKGRDIDICLFLDKKYPNLSMSKKRLKFLSHFNYDIQIFQQLPIYIRKRILKGKILYAKDENKLYEIAYDTIKEFNYFEKHYKTYLEHVKNGQRKNLK